MTPRERATARKIAALIAQLHGSGISKSKLLIAIDEKFPGASFRSFLGGLFLFDEAERARNGRVLH
jgi:hypothetical protein